MKYCYKCGNELYDEAVQCPKCGAMQDENYESNNYKEQRNYAANNNCENPVWGTLALIFGILGSVGIVFGIIGLVQYKNDKDPNHSKNKKKSIAGLVLGIVWTVLTIILYAAAIALSASETI